MQVQVNANNNLEGQEALAAEVSGVVENALSRISDHITGVVVRVSAENSHKGGQNDKRCALEPRLEGWRPVAVTHQAAILDQAVNGAVEKLTRLIVSGLDPRREKTSHRTYPPSPGSAPEETA